ncbi:tudor domain-containing protein 5-like [Drosophila guanche]|uniref:Blast:Tudor domain-containing protein 5 n=1 Tax=Drosophila guanche TaxID=7266 RepID=A0A3B0K723_DROGU|nr:tudor domain-containing protein 5-like [Drosophila guanche]SPP89093.1 blast:Tudor domain-containing protein 5 [Drosophila guanche]
MMDEPKNEVMLDQKLRRLPMGNVAGREEKLKILITNVFSPLQFWFQFVESNNKYNLEGLHSKMSEFYAWHQAPIIPGTLLPGSICAAASKWVGWRRVRILSESPDNATHVSVFYLDYGCEENIACKDLRFLPKMFTDVPAMAVRGALSRVHPLEYMWPGEASMMFRQKVMFGVAYAQVIEEDLQEAIYYMEVYRTKKPGALSVNSLMIQNKLAVNGAELQFSNHCERRLCYVQERLPSFEMLETGAFPMDADREFQKHFRGIVCTASFVMEFKVPHTTNPFLQDLTQALLDWMIGFKKKQIEQITPQWGAMELEYELENELERDLIEWDNDQEEAQMVKKNEEPEQANDQEALQKELQELKELMELHKFTEQEELQEKYLQDIKENPEQANDQETLQMVKKKEEPEQQAKEYGKMFEDMYKEMYNEFSKVHK